ncbi:hypothetical protein MVLG_06383 [Microbotryum lychnidis-dioicae p1A1 Lamole]|uniref:Uncharacterized protein n=1 Tax=Microbotryum lychnidis-dioicae (strain p1A1 Lamole / MvSl-1064) TaxID=683840 RepID=U5HH43_USTV1|nr:hypothetical protein MVLG_06383 [Microbotryum lychnidis-dioicae p1A1 Lamole]|eukprot:KDE03122.1 hypothetical protein MVLG_06383 [Microbotryum lychnidis-dioicae p1A1 Lamole]
MTLSPLDSGKSYGQAPRASSWNNALFNTPQRQRAEVPHSTNSLRRDFTKLIAAGLHLGPAVQEYLAKNKVTTIWDLKPGKKEISIADPDYGFHLQRKPISRYTKASAASRNEPRGDRLNKGTQLHQRPRGNGHQADRITSAMEKIQQALLADSTAQPITITGRMGSRPYGRTPPALRPAAPTR